MKDHADIVERAGTLIRNRRFMVEDEREAVACLFDLGNEFAAIKNPPC
jgi:hypothetical protein